MPGNQQNPYNTNIGGRNEDLRWLLWYLYI
jgi:hypothetical protein